MAGKLISIEGIEGAGKSTALKYIQDYLAKAGKSVLLTREPGGTPLAEKLRELLLHTESNEKVYPKTELLMMFASRSQHISEVILPALKANQWVLCDRFVDASYAYQGGGRGLNIAWIAELDKMVVGDLKPEATFLLDIDPVLGLERSKNRGPQDRIEKEKVAFFEKVRHAYLERAKAEPQRFHLIQAALPLEAVQTQLLAVLETLL